MKRFAYNVVLLVSLITLPWYASLLIGVLGVFLFRRFYELPAATVFVISLYGGSSTGAALSVGVSFLLLVLIEFLKPRVAFYPDY